MGVWKDCFSVDTLFRRGRRVVDMEEDMNFAEAVRLVEKALNNPKNLTDMESMNMGVATAMLAREYVKVRDRIMPA